MNAPVEVVENVNCSWCLHQDDLLSSSRTLRGSVSLPPLRNQRGSVTSPDLNFDYENELNIANYILKENE